MVTGADMVICLDGRGSAKSGIDQELRSQEEGRGYRKLRENQDELVLKKESKKTV
jgi:hypothetical protein